MKSDPKYQAKWYGIIKELYDSGLTMKSFSSERNINYYQIQYWKRKYNKINKIDQKKAFIKVKQKKQVKNSKVIKVNYGKLTIELTDRFNETSLLKILKVADQVV